MGNRNFLIHNKFISNNNHYCLSGIQILLSLVQLQQRSGPIHE
jgi:hypothetical protein